MEAWRVPTKKKYLRERGERTEGCGGSLPCTFCRLVQSNFKYFIWLNIYNNSTPLLKFPPELSSVVTAVSPPCNLDLGQSAMGLDLTGILICSNSQKYQETQFVVLHFESQDMDGWKKIHTKIFIVLSGGRFFKKISMSKSSFMAPLCIWVWDRKSVV